jgi:hypothetical protein
MVSSGRVRRRGRSRETDPAIRDLVQQCTTAFWDVYLKNDDAAKKWFIGGGFEALLGRGGTFKMKLNAGG